jgi:hypothetical protein
MPDSVVRLRNDQQSRLAQGYRENGIPAPQWPVGTQLAASLTWIDSIVGVPIFFRQMQNVAVA